MKKTLVVGASEKAHRYSNLAVQRLVEKDYPVVALGVKEGEIGEVPITSERIPYQDIDTVTLYLKAGSQPPYYDYLISLNPRRIIFNPGTENPEFYDLLLKAGIEVDVACTLVLLGTDQY